jgi:hypothetical protein
MRLVVVATELFTVTVEVAVAVLPAASRATVVTTCAPFVELSVDHVML